MKALSFITFKPTKKCIWPNRKHVELSCCPICHINMTFTNDRTRASWDHIIPHMKGGRTFLHNNTTINLRLMCQGCNVTLASIGGCIGALACLVDIAKATDMPYSVVVHFWHMRLVINGLIYMKNVEFYTSRVCRKTNTNIAKAKSVLTNKYIDESLKKYTENKVV